MCVLTSRNKHLVGCCTIGIWILICTEVARTANTLGRGVDAGAMAHTWEVVVTQTATINIVVYLLA